MNFHQKNIDPREAPEIKLTLKSGLGTPAGTVFIFDDGLHQRIVKGEGISDIPENFVVGKLEMNGVKHQFGAMDLQMVFAENEAFSDNTEQAKLGLVTRIYLFRHLYVFIFN